MIQIPSCGGNNDKRAKRKSFYGQRFRNALGKDNGGEEKTASQSENTDTRVASTGPFERR